MTKGIDYTEEMIGPNEYHVVVDGRTYPFRKSNDLGDHTKEEFKRTYGAYSPKELKDAQDHYAALSDGDGGLADD